MFTYFYQWFVHSWLTPSISINHPKSIVRDAEKFQALRAITGLGLKEAMMGVDGLLLGLMLSEKVKNVFFFFLWDVLDFMGIHGTWCENWGFILDILWEGPFGYDWRCNPAWNLSMAHAVHPSQRVDINLISTPVTIGFSNSCVMPYATVTDNLPIWITSKYMFCWAVSC